MARKRLSREGSRERTAQRLLDAAARLIARKGFERISIEDVAGAAGYSRGAFYSNFGSKSALFLELLRRDREQVNTRFEAALDDSLPPDQMHARMQEIYAALYLEGGSFLTWTEARMLAARDARFRVKLTQLMSEKCDHAVRLLEHFCERARGHPIGPLEPLAVGFLSLMEGLRLFGASCPDEMSASIAEAILKVFSDAVLQTSGQLNLGERMGDGGSGLPTEVQCGLDETSSPPRSSGPGAGPERRGSSVAANVSRMRNRVHPAAHPAVALREIQEGLAGLA